MEIDGLSVLKTEVCCVCVPVHACAHGCTIGAAQPDPPPDVATAQPLT